MLVLLLRYLACKHTYRHTCAHTHTLEDIYILIRSHTNVDIVVVCVVVAFAADVAVDVVDAYTI